jgi:hypothetical protein
MAKKTAKEAQDEYQDRYPTITEIVAKLEYLVEALDNEGLDVYTKDGHKLIARLRRIQNSAVIFEP